MGNSLPSRESRNKTSRRLRRLKLPTRMEKLVMNLLQKVMLRMTQIRLQLNRQSTSHPMQLRLQKKSFRCLRVLLSSRKRPKRRNGENSESISTPPTRSEKFAKKLEEEIEDVATNWNIDDNGELEKNKNKFYNNMGLKKLPKNDKHIKSKKSLGKNSIDEDEVFFDQDETLLTPNGTQNSSMDISQTSDVENVTQNETKKKKKKKKKNKDIE